MTDSEKEQAIKQAIRTFLALLPKGMEVTFYRDGNGPVRMETVYPDGKTMLYQAVQKAVH